MLQKLINTFIKQNILSLIRVKDTFDERFSYLRLDKNERLIPFNNKLFKKFISTLKFEDFSGYSELGPLYRKLSCYLGVSESQLLITSGSDLAIKSVFEACVSKGDNVILHLPSYAMYRVYAKMFGANVRLVPIKKNWKIDINRMLENIDSKTRMLVIENPNGFLGTKISLNSIKKCASYLLKKNILLLIDEAYYYVENTTSTTHNLINDFPNILITQTFSKAHGLAGARFGYIISHEELMQHISKVKPMHEVAGITGVAASWIIDNPRLLEEFHNSIIDSKIYLINSLKKLNIKCKDTHANFVLIYFSEHEKSKYIVEKLKEEHILIRRPFEEKNLKGWSRVCVGSISDSKLFIRALKNILE